MDFDEALDYLLSLGHETLAIKLGLTNTELLLEALDDPQKSFPALQIAGTNGKGSTAVMLEEMLRAGGFVTGLYTSPHLTDITERIRIDDQEISREDFARLATRVREKAVRLLDAGALSTLPTFFEQVTAIAFCAFAEAGVELAILETGLGGRLDATTTARAGVVGITPIALDHQEYLGETLSEIAAEKAAIIRPDVMAAIVAPQDPVALRMILKRCAACGVVPRMSDHRVEVTGTEEMGRVRATFRTNKESYENVLLGLRGRHQITNASTAIALAEALGELNFTLSRAHIIEGLARARHAGRLELRRAGRTEILFDGAHNVAGASALRSFLDEFVGASITLIFGAMRDKDLTEISKTLYPIARELILTRPAGPRAAAPESLAKLAPRDFSPDRIHLARSSTEAFGIALRRTPPGGLICVTGSLYLVGEIRRWIMDEERSKAEKPA
jgi:dihydrofolate synthase / folylpolyglutamate synthase